MADENTVKTDSGDTFECVVRSHEPLSQDFHAWPDDLRAGSDKAVEKFLQDHPGSTVVGDTSMSMDDTNPRYPENDEKGLYFGVRTIKLDEPVEVESPERGEYSAVIHLRQFEDEHFPDAVRIRDQIEKGSGSPFQLAKPEVRAQHAALEKLIEAEAKLAAAHTALIQADTDYEAALAATEPKPNAPSE